MPVTDADSLDKELIEKIQKLYAKAQSTDSEEEAQAFMAKVQKLLLQHNLSMSHIESHKRKGKDDITRDKVDLNQYTNRKEGAWTWELMTGIAEFYFCKGIHLVVPNKKDHMGYFAFIGTPANIDQCIQMTNYLIPTIKDWYKRAWKVYDGDQKPGAYKRDFLSHCVLRLKDRMAVITLANKRELEKESGENITALMIVNHKAVTEFYEKEYPNSYDVKRAKTQKRDGAFEGDKAGRNISLSNQIESSSPKGAIK